MQASSHKELETYIMDLQIYFDKEFYRQGLEKYGYLFGEEFDKQIKLYIWASWTWMARLN